jgi:two-component system chemotaxis response regulator CheB
VQGVLLSGGLDDGVAGLAAIKRCGGVTMVQDPREALMPSMPQTAIETIGVEHVLPAARIASLIGELAFQELPPPERIPDDVAIETQIALYPAGGGVSPASIGRLSTLCCPTCHGNLWELEEEGGLRYRCRTGHAFAPLALEAAQNFAAEEAIVIAIRTLEERADLYRNMARKARQQGRVSLAMRWESRLRETLLHRDAIRDVLLGAQLAITETPA